MAWDSSDRRTRLPSNWSSTIQPRILRRDHHHCLWGSLPEDHYPVGLCPTQATEVDHIGSDTDHREANLRALCTYHHRVRSGRQGQVASTAAHNARKATLRRVEEPHPGGWT